MGIDFIVTIADSGLSIGLPSLELVNGFGEGECPGKGLGAILVGEEGANVLGHLPGSGATALDPLRYFFASSREPPSARRMVMTKTLSLTAPANSSSAWYFSAGG